MNLSLTTIILAGGQSSRMGQDKALLSLDGIPLLTRTCHLALPFSETVYVVTPWVERYQESIPPPCRIYAEIWPENCVSSPGPLWAFAQALPLISTEWVLLLACDLPQLTLTFLEEGIGQLPSLPSSTLAFLPRSQLGWEPLCGFYHSLCLPSLKDFLAQGGKSFQGWLAQITVQAFVLKDPLVLFNCNTPKDWEQITENQSLSSQS